MLQSMQMPENLWQTKKEELKQAEKEVVSGVPPPPQEVKVRTLKSDLESMAKSGGGLPQFQSVPVSLSASTGGEEQSKRRIRTFFVVAAIAAVVAAAAVVYLAYRPFSDGGEIAGDGFSEQAAAVPAPAPEQIEFVGFVHVSLLRLPADTMLVFAVPAVAENVFELQTFSQRFRGFLAEAGPEGDFLEVRMQSSDGRDLAAHELLDLLGALVLPPEFFLTHFNPDPTFFVWRDGEALWPGIILKLGLTENWLFLRDEVAGLERSAKVANLFLRSPGVPSSDGFQDVIVNGQPARKLEFSSGASLVYGWFRGHLILSTSEEGLKEALARL